MIKRKFVENLSVAPIEANQEQREYIENMTDGDRAIFWNRYQQWVNVKGDRGSIELSILDVESNNYGAVELSRNATDEEAARAYLDHMIEAEKAERPDEDPDFERLAEAIATEREAEIMMDRKSKATILVFKQDEGVPELL